MSSFKKIRIKNFMGIDDIEFEPGDYCEISGKNGNGKSSIIDAILTVIGHEHDPARIRKGCDFAEVIIECDNGYVLKMRTRPKSTTWDFKDDEGHAITRSDEYIKSICNSLSQNPVSFLKAKPEEQLKTYQAALPIKVSAQDLSFIPINALNGVDLNKHALVVIGDKSSGIYQKLYDERTEINRDIKKAAAEIDVLRQSLPEDPPEGNWDENYQRKSFELSKLRTDAQIKVGSIRNDAKAALDSAEKLFREKQSALQKECIATIQKMREDAQKRIAAIERELTDSANNIEADTAIAENVERGKMESIMSAARESERAALDLAKADFEPKNNALVSEISQAKTMIDEHARHEAQRKMIADKEEDLKKDIQKSDSLTAYLDKLNDLKTGLVASSPIPGMDIVDGELYLDGIPFRLVNKARQIDVWFQISNLSKSKCQTVVCDDFEHLDSEHREIFKQRALASGRKHIVARVTDDLLSISAEEKGAA
jgi:hypothetical protein